MGKDLWLIPSKITKAAQAPWENFFKIGKTTLPELLNRMPIASGAMRGFLEKFDSGLLKGFEKNEKSIVSLLRKKKKRTVLDKVKGLFS